MIRDGYCSPVGAAWQTGYHPTEWYDSNPYLTRYVIPGSLRYSIHTGIDLQRAGNADAGAPVYAIADGLVVFAERGRGTWGNVVVIQHDKVFSRYAHLERVRVTRGDRVACGTQIAVIGKSGMEYVERGEHLHFDISHTTLLSSAPLHWAGDNRALVMQHYINPTAFLLSAANYALCVAVPRLRVRSAPSLDAPTLRYIPHGALVRFETLERGADGNQWLSLADGGYAVASWLIW